MTSAVQFPPIPTIRGALPATLWAIKRETAMRSAAVRVGTSEVVPRASR